jgi:hypothetical protein
MRGASIAALAHKHGIGINRLRRWVNMVTGEAGSTAGSVSGTTSHAVCPCDAHGCRAGNAGTAPIVLRTPARRHRTRPRMPATPTWQRWWTCGGSVTACEPDEASGSQPVRLATRVGSRAAARRAAALAARRDQHRSNTPASHSHLSASLLNRKERSSTSRAKTRFKDFNCAIQSCNLSMNEIGDRGPNVWSTPSRPGTARSEAAI